MTDPYQHAALLPCSQLLFYPYRSPDLRRSQTLPKQPNGPAGLAATTTTPMVNAAALDLRRNGRSSPSPFADDVTVTTDDIPSRTDESDRTLRNSSTGKTTKKSPPQPAIRRHKTNGGEDGEVGLCTVYTAPAAATVGTPALLSRIAC